MRSVRLALVGAMALSLTLWAGHVFDRVVPELVLAAAVPLLVATITRTRRWFVRLPAAIAGIVVAVTAIAVIGDGGLAEVGTAFTSGLRRLLSTEWPSPVRPDLTATVGLVLALAAALAAEFATRLRLRLAPIGPIAVGGVVVIALSAPRGASAFWPTVIAVLGAALAALGPNETVGGEFGDATAVRNRLRLLRGERRLLGMSATVALVVTAVAIPVTMNDRADPRDTEDPDRSATLLDPIEATLALQQLDPVIDLHTIELDGGTEPTPIRWRTAALADYNGRRWTPDLALRPIGRRLTTDDDVSGPTLDATISFLDDDLQLVPLPGVPVVVDADIETDEARTLVRLVERPDGDTVVRVTTLVDPTGPDEIAEPLGSRAIDDSVSGLADLADELAGDVLEDEGATVSEQLRAIEQTMRNDFVLDPDAPGGGLQRALIERFLRETQRGNAEQFATAFVLLARSKGADARVATGFVVDPERVDGSVIVLSSADAAIWPEVRSGQEWLAFDPVPATPLADETPPPAEPTVQSPAAPQPPIAPPPDDIDEPIDTEESGDESVDGAVPTFVEVVIQASAVAGLVLLPVLLVVALILGAKWRRRRHRLRGRPEQRIRGAWQEATDHLVDAGLTIEGAMTNDEIARAGWPIAPTATRELDRLAALSTAVTFGDPARPDLLADDATTCLDVVERSVDVGRPIRSRARRRLSLRSLRSRTKTPV